MGPMVERPRRKSIPASAVWTTVEGNENPPTGPDEGCCLAWDHQQPSPRPVQHILRDAAMQPPVMSSDPELHGVVGRQVRRTQVERNTEREAAISSWTESDPRGDARLRCIRVPAAGHAQQAGFEAGCVADGEKLLGIGAGSAVADAAQFPRHR